MTQVNNKMLDELAKIAGGAVSAAGGVVDEVRGMAVNQGEKIINEMELVRREDFDILKQLVTKLATENDALKARLSVLEEKAGIEAFENDSD